MVTPLLVTKTCREQKHMNASNKTLPIIELFRRERATKGQVPVITGELRDRDLEIRAVRKKHWESNSKSGRTAPSIEPKPSRSTIMHHELD